MIIVNHCTSLGVVIAYHYYNDHSISLQLIIEVDPEPKNLGGRLKRQRNMTKTTSTSIVCNFVTMCKM